MQKIIAFTGKAGVGKTTSARLLKDRYKSRATIMSFAYRLKHLLVTSKTCTEEQIKNKRARTVMQNFGSLMRQHINKNFWINLLEHDMKMRSFDVILIDDVRYLNEALWVKNNSGIIIRILSDKYRSIDSKTINQNHQSETEMDLICANYTVINNGTFEELYKTLTGIIAI